MEDFQESLRIKITGKTHYAMLSFLRKHGADTHDLSSFIEDAIRWRIFDREMAYLHAKEGGEVSVLSDHRYAENAKH